MHKKTLKLTVAAALLAGSIPAFADHSLMHTDPEVQASGINVTMYKSPTCGCCGGWAEHMEANGFVVTSVPTQVMYDVKKEHGVPSNLMSCHTSVIGGKVFEGHIPASDIRAYLENPTADTVGLALPGMPMGSPGMEAGGFTQDFEVMAFNEDGESQVFSEHKD